MVMDDTYSLFVTIYHFLRENIFSNVILIETNLSRGGKICLLNRGFDHIKHGMISLLGNCLLLMYYISKLRGPVLVCAGNIDTEG